MLGGALALAFLAVVVWFSMRSWEPETTAGCDAPAGATLRDVDTDDSPEFPWPHTPGQEVTVHFEAGELPPRYAGLLTEAAAIWAQSPCVEPVVVDECPAGSNCSSVITHPRAGSWDTDGESSSVDRHGIRQSNTITLYTDLLDASSDNGALATIVHEMGHALGLVHRNDRDSVMNARTDDSTDPVPDAIDFANLEVIYG